MEPAIVETSRERVLRRVAIVVLLPLIVSAYIAGSMLVALVLVGRDLVADLRQMWNEP